MTEAVKTWRVLDILKVTEEAFRNKGIINPRLNAELLLCDATGDKRIDLYLNFEKPLTSHEVSAYREKVKRRLKNEPLQYILGKTEFYGLPLKVNNNVLIPRQETEILVDKSLEYIEQVNIKNSRILEIGTGSGCIALAIAANTECNIYAIDISQQAIELAKENSGSLNLKGTIKFERKDFLKDIISLNEFNLIVSNPPYIPVNEIAGLNEEVNAFEPYEALTDGSDGLVFYKKIFEMYKNEPIKPQVFLELGDGKKNNITDLLNSLSITGVIIHNDLMGIPRVLELKGTEN